MSSTELIANLFRISQTEEKLRKDEIIGAKAATATHYKVGKEVRGAIEKIGGTMTEDLPTPEKSIQQVKKESMFCGENRISQWDEFRYLLVIANWGSTCHLRQ